MQLALVLSKATGIGDKSQGRGDPIHGLGVLGMVAKAEQLLCAVAVHLTDKPSYKVRKLPTMFKSDEVKKVR